LRRRTGATNPLSPWERVRVRAVRVRAWARVQVKGEMVKVRTVRSKRTWGETISHERENRAFWKPRKYGFTWLLKIGKRL
jgi:hypothetical protein